MAQCSAPSDWRCGVRLLTPRSAPRATVLLCGRRTTRSTKEPEARPDDDAAAR